MRQTWVRITVAVGLILLPIAVWFFRTNLPGSTTIATGPRSGLYMEIMSNVRTELNYRGVQALSVDTSGSIDNLRRLREGEVDFCLYQTGTVDFLAERLIAEHDANGDATVDREEFENLRRDSSFVDLHGARKLAELDTDEDGRLELTELIDLPGVRFVANTHYDVAHLIVRDEVEGVEIDSLSQLVSLAEQRELDISVGSRSSGDYAVSRILLRAVGLGGLVREQHLEYDDVVKDLLDPAGNLEGALIMAGDLADVLDSLLATGTCRLLPIRHAAALARRNILLTPHEILAGFYRSGSDPIPSDNIQTVALRAQLLTREDVSEVLVAEVTHVVRQLAFVKKNQLRNLFDEGDRFARRHAEFPLHRGAESVYDPDLHPFLPTEFVESTEGIRSFVVSFIIAGFFAFRWLRERRRKNSDHRLDRYIRSLLEIERRQNPLDHGSTGGGDLEPLQDLLDEVTHLRQEALGELSAHELNEDRGAACFVDMCHELSQKINAKLTRQSMERQFARLAEAVSGSGDGSRSPRNRNEER